MDPQSIVSLTSAVAPFFAGVIALITYLFFRSQRQTNGLLEAFKILNTDEHRNARRKVFQIYESYKKTNELRMFFVPDVEKVRADFDLMGTLVKSKTVNKKQFLRQFGPSAYLCWNRLRDHIHNERQLRNFDPFMSDFQWLIEQAEIYWQHQGYDISKIRVHLSEPIKAINYDFLE